MMLSVHERHAYLLSLPERLVRALAAAVGGTATEAAEVVLPRVVRRSRLYEATARNLLRVLTELVGSVEGPPSAAGEYEPDPGRLAVRKTAGNALELGSIAAFGFSPLWLLAAAADASHGSRVYLDAFVRELQAAGVLRDDAAFRTVDDLLAALQGTSGTAARLIDIPPLELEALRRTLADLRADASGLPSASELERLFHSLEREAERERQSVLDVSVGIGLAFFNSARHVGRQHLLDPYTEDLSPLRREGFADYARRVGRPYADAVARHFDRDRTTLTERGLTRLRRGPPA